MYILYSGAAELLTEQQADKCYIKAEVLREDILVEKQIFSKKSQNLFGFQRSQIESQLNGANG